MIAMTNANMKNLPTTPAPAPPKSWDKRDRAKAAAVKALGPQAIPEFDFTVYKCDGRWMWRAIAEDKRPAVSAAQVKANGGKEATKTMISDADRIAGEEVAAAALAKKTADKIAATAKGTPVEKLATEIAEKAGERLDKAKLDTTEVNGIPAFLKREGDTSVEAKEALIAKHKKTTGPDRQIKNPPNVKDAKAKTGKGKRAGGRGQSKTAMVGQLLLRKEGCTTADILKATGWPSVSVPAQAKAVGLGVRKEKDGKVTRYYGVPKK